VSAEAVEILEPGGDSPELVAALTERAGTRFIYGEHRGAVEAADRAIAMAASIGLPESARALGFRGGARCVLGDRGGLEDFRRALELAKAQGLGREVADRALAGESLTRLSAELNSRAIPTSLGGRWQPSKLRSLLTSPFHTGRFPDGTPGSWPAIFSDDEATLLRARFPRDENAGVGRGRGPRPGRAYALAGIAVCSECGRKLLGSSGAYRCQARNGGCGKVRIPSWPVDQYVDEQVWRRPEVWEADAEEAAHQRQRTTDTEPLLVEVRAAEARLLELHEAYAAGEITLNDFKLMRDAVGRRAEAAEARMRAMVPAPVPTWRYPSDEDFAEAEELYARWQRRELTPEEIAEQNDFFRAWIEKVVVSPARRRGRPRKDAPSDVPDRVRIVWR
jgi:hypothetical protein